MRYYILAIDSYHGGTTSRDQSVFDESTASEAAVLYAVIAIDDSGSACIVDDGYRDRAEAVAAWPEAR
jgi:hypothetical protein